MLHRCTPILLVSALIVLLTACIAPAQDQARSPHVVMTPACVVARMDAAAVAAPSILADAIAPAAVDARGVVQTVVPPPVQPPQVAPAAAGLMDSEATA